MGLLSVCHTAFRCLLQLTLQVAQLSLVLSLQLRQRLLMKLPHGTQLRLKLGLLLLLILLCCSVHASHSSNQLLMLLLKSLSMFSCLSGGPGCCCFQGRSMLDTESSNGILVLLFLHQAGPQSHCSCHSKTAATLGCILGLSLKFAAGSVLSLAKSGCATTGRDGMHDACKTSISDYEGHGNCCSCFYSVHAERQGQCFNWLKMQPL